MADLGESFDPSTVPEDDRSFEPVPAGDYEMQVIDSEIKDTKDGNGQMLVLTLEITQGPNANRRIWDRLNIRNQNADAQRIAQRALADLCLAIGVASVRETEELHFKPFVGRVGIRQDKTGQYGPQNTVRYKPKGGQAPQQQANASTSRQTQNSSSSANKTAAKTQGARPWANKQSAA